MLQDIEESCTILLPIVGLLEMAKTLFIHNILWQTLLIPCTTCALAIARVMYLLYVRRYEINPNDMLITVGFFAMNSISIYNLLRVAPYCTYSLLISVYFQYMMIRLLQKMFCNCMAPQITWTVSPVTHAIKKSTWVIPSTHHRKCKDTCLLCLDPLQAIEYVFVSLYCSDSHVHVDMQVTNLLLQCNTCSCTLHLQCYLQCQAQCPICSMHA